MFSKSELRRELNKRLATFSPGFFTAEGMAVAASLTKTPLWGEYETLLLFLSMKNEIDTGPLLEAALAAGKKVFAPRINGEDLSFYRVRSPAGPWQEGAFGIREPAGPGTAGENGPGEQAPAYAHPAPLSPADFPALIIVPGLGFDRRGNRLGRGKGYYDRFLKSLDKKGLSFKAIGFCLEAQLLPEIPADPWDRRVDHVYTGRE
ncbi:MAG: 5-formyltetrahydrofolate cyclo-ligase [Treponema sp.]|nr:5-formyltetrahydrofolate cyclo-ligase [Treponema sp.]